MIDRSVIAVLAGCVAFAGLIAGEILASGVDDTDLGSVSAPVEAVAPPQKPKPQAGDLMTVALAQPLFSPSRRSPDNTVSSGSDLSGLRLTGIVIKPDRRIAIFASADAKALERAEGETLSDWRLDQISPLEVSLSGPGGTRTLVPKPDPNRPTLRTQSATSAKAAQPPAASQAQRPAKTPQAGSSESPSRPPLANQARGQ